MVIDTEKFDRIEVTSQQELRAWLSEHHCQSTSIWLVTYKKHVRGRYVSTSEILDELLCFGWIDGIRRKVNADQTMQLISPRQAQHWAGTYKVRVERLQVEGRMHQAGLNSIEFAKQNGEWTLMEDVDALQMPNDLSAILNVHPMALNQFNAFAPSYRRIVLCWLKFAKTSATRQKRLLQIAHFSRDNKRIPQM
jgi:uncharacterized protein YdeI (YjbR/CyaY-like superfamily)